MTSDTCFFQTGGSLDEDSPSYIERPVDRELLNALERGDLCLILAPRQTGKSSLMYHAVARLKPMGICAGIVDLQPLGSYGDMNVWFGGVVYSIGQSLGLETDAAAWWNEHALLVPTQRFMTFMEEAAKTERLQTGLKAPDWWRMMKRSKQCLRAVSMPGFSKKFCRVD